MKSAELFAKLDTCFNAEAASGINAVFQFIFNDDDDYYIVIDNSTKNIQPGTHDAPTVTITTDVGTLLGTIDGSVNGMSAFMSGQLKAQGNVILAQKLNTLFPITV